MPPSSLQGSINGVPYQAPPRPTAEMSGRRVTPVDGEREVIPKSLQIITGKMAQEFISRSPSSAAILLRESFYYTS